MLAELQRELAVLQALVAKYDALELMHRAAYMLLPLFMKYRSENEFLGEEAYFLPTVEYLQYLIARTAPITDSKKPSEEEWEEIWAQARKIMHLTYAHLFTRPTLTNPPTEIDELRFSLDGQRLIVRVQRYSVFLADHLRSSLLPYEQQIREIYGVGVEGIVDGISKINEYQKTGVIGRYEAMRNTTVALMERLVEHGYDIAPDASDSEKTRIQVALTGPDFREGHIAANESARLALTSAIFDITDVTALPKSFLSLLSVTPGESVLTTLTGRDHDDLSPLSPSMLHYKPFLEVDGRYYTFYHSGFEDHIADIVEADLFEKRPGQVSDMAGKRGDRLESDAGDLLKAIIQPDFAYQNVYYPNPDDAGNLTELDHLIGVDDILFLVEAKAGGFSAGASRGAPKSLIEALSDLIMEGQRQSERAEKYIKSASEVAFFDETGKIDVHRIRQSDWRKIFRVVVTREELGWVGAKLAILSLLDPSLSKSYPWHISLDDLRVIVDLFRSEPIRFVHYLELRLLAAAEPVLRQADELEHVALYNKLNYYHEPPAQGMHRVSYDASYMNDIDHYFMDKSAGIESPRPTQDMPLKIRALLSALTSCGLHGRFAVGSIVLSMSSEARQGFKDGLDMIDAGRDKGRQRTIRTGFSENKVGLSISYAEGGHWQEELRRSAFQMVQSECHRWFVVQLAPNSPYEVSAIELITPGRFTAAELTEAQSHCEAKTNEAIAAEKPGRNDRCPCGSGKKFKRCHGMSFS
ncbi:MAG: YecA family protein [Minisyncoccota bacterium]